MNCFYHADQNAVGLCKACSKGLCLECVSDLGHGIACKNKHESDVENLNMIITKSTKIYASAPRNTLVTPAFYFFMGLVLAGYGYTSRGGITGLLFVFGIGIIVFSIVIFLHSRALWGKKGS